jgi:hypothetical protein
MRMLRVGNARDLRLRGVLMRSQAWLWNMWGIASCNAIGHAIVNFKAKCGIYFLQDQDFRAQLLTPRVYKKDKCFQNSTENMLVGFELGPDQNSPTSCPI